MQNERGGIISNLIIIPAALVLMAGFFFLGYYVGKYQGSPAAQAENAPPLPEVLSRNLPKPEDFTFYKTLTEKENRTVSIDLRPKAAETETKSEQPAADALKGMAPEGANGKKTSAPASGKQGVVKPAPEKKNAAETTAASSKPRYTVQVSAHREKPSAEEEVKKMKRSGFAAFIVTSELPGKGTWYRVRLGSFTKKDAAEKLQKELHAKLGGSPIITIE
jgi:cell division septation protein DedD